MGFILDLFYYFQVSVARPKYRSLAQASVAEMSLILGVVTSNKLNVVSSVLSIMLINRRNFLTLTVLGEVGKSLSIRGLPYLSRIVLSKVDYCHFEHANAEGA